jgi:hypothetical protein
MDRIVVGRVIDEAAGLLDRTRLEPADDTR